MAAERHRARLVTLAFVRHGDEILLIRHPQDGRRFAGQWNGIGGHVEAEEGIHAAAVRELQEEAGVEVADLRLRVVTHESGLLGEAHVVFVFGGESASRALHAGPGHEVAWHPLREIEALPLVHDVLELLPHVFSRGDPVFLVESYDGGDRRVSLALDGPDPAATRAEGNRG